MTFSRRKFFSKIQIILRKFRLNLKDFIIKEVPAHLPFQKKEEIWKKTSRFVCAKQVHSIEKLHGC